MVYLKVQPSVLVHHDDVSRPEVDVSLLPDILNDLLLVVLRVVHVSLNIIMSRIT